MDRCGGCRRKVTTLHQGMECELCEQWWHRRCTHVSAQEYVDACKEGNDLDFICSNCKDAICGDDQVRTGN